VGTFAAGTFLVISLDGKSQPFLGPGILIVNLGGIAASREVVARRTLETQSISAIPQEIFSMLWLWL